MRSFITTGKCIPSMHYMVDISRQVEYGANMVRKGDYFCINRGRQYGKTTTLSLLKKKLEAEGFVVFSISFEGLEDCAFNSVEKLITNFFLSLQESIPNNLSDENCTLVDSFSNKDEYNSFSFRRVVRQLCSEQKVVVFIDEVDQASNYPSFIKFLGLLRDMYLKRDEAPTFQSIVLASVFDIKNLRLKIRPEEMHTFNSPWNIALPFNAEMELPVDGIANMLSEYKADYNVDFDEKLVAKEIFNWTSGYPYLVSNICRIIADPDNKLSWDKYGVEEAVKVILREPNCPLVESFTKKLSDYPELATLLREILFNGTRMGFVIQEKYTKLAYMFGFIKDNNSQLQISNRFYELMLYNLFIEEDKHNSLYSNGANEKNQFVKDGYLDMPLILKKFSQHFNDVYGTNDEKFIENQGRKMFLLYLRPIINGIGNYYVEAETRDHTRTDIVIDYKAKQYVIELKIWHGEEYNRKGEIQLSEYLDYFHLDEVYMVSFCFNKSKVPGVHEVMLGGKKLIEAVI